MELTHISLFTGIGGIDLAAEWAGFRTILMVENNAYCQKVLNKYWPDVPIIGDIKDVKGEEYRGTVTLVTGGFPCQPVSQAGKRRGKEDDRWLWPEMLRVITEVRPKWVVAENTAGLITMGLDDCLSDLEREGYITETFLIPACAVNAPHRRDRIFIVANSRSRGFSESELGSEQSGRTEVVCSSKNRSSNEGAGRQDVANTEGSRFRQGRYSGSYEIQREDRKEIPQIRGRAVSITNTEGARLEGSNSEGDSRTGGRSSEYGQRERQADWWAVEPDVGRVAHGISSRVDRLKCLGNAVVPQQIYPVLKAIAEMVRR